MKTYLEQFNHLPELSQDAAWQRQENNAIYGEHDEVGSTAYEHNPLRPAVIGDQFLEIDLFPSEGTAKFPYVASLPLNRVYENITKVYFVYHGELRNVWDYYHNFIAALGDNFEPNTTLVVAPQFPAAVDPIDDRTLRWGINSYRGAEPAEYPLPPYSSFDADDDLKHRVMDLCPNLVEIEEVGSSEGGQLMDRRLAWGRAEIYAEQNGIIVSGRIQNAGSYQYWHEIRPKLLNPRDKVRNWKFDWITPRNPKANRWPYGLYDPQDPEFHIYGPPPYVSDYLINYPIGSAISAYMRRASISIAMEDNYPRGSRVPTNVGAAEQGATRLERAVGKWEYLKRYIGHTVFVNPQLFFMIHGVGHDAAQNFNLVEMIKRQMRIGHDSHSDIGYDDSLSLHIEPALAGFYNDRQLLDELQRLSDMV
jgi:hypothetical protein